MANGICQLRLLTANQVRLTVSTGLRSAWSENPIAPVSTHTQRVTFHRVGLTHISPFMHFSAENHGLGLPVRHSCFGTVTSLE